MINILGSLLILFLLKLLFDVSVLNKRGVFSGPANMSRLKAQLSLDAGKL